MKLMELYQGKLMGAVIDTLRDELRKAQFSPEKIPIKIKRLIAIPDYPEKLMKMVEKAVTSS